MTTEQLLKFWYDWQASSKTERFGQYVMNCCEAVPQPNPILFYEEDARKAFNWFYKWMCMGATA